jgi:CRP/FNR family transcriptional regulator
MVGEASKIEVIRSSTLLGGLTEDQVVELAVVSRQAQAEKGELIWLDGNSVPFFGIVESGFVKMSRTTASGHEVTTEIMGPGQIFGLLGTLDGTGCPQTAKAVCRTRYLKVSKSTILPIYHSNSFLKEQLVHTTAIRLRQAFDMISHLSSGKVDQRVAAVLLLLAQSFGEERGVEIQLKVPLTRQDIAEMAGTTVETTIRVLSKWQKEGLVSTKSHLILIKSPQQLMSRARGEEPAFKPSPPSASH